MDSNDNKRDKIQTTIIGKVWRAPCASWRAPGRAHSTQHTRPTSSPSAQASPPETSSPRTPHPLPSTILGDGHRPPPPLLHPLPPPVPPAPPRCGCVRSMAFSGYLMGHRVASHSTASGRAGRLRPPAVWVSMIQGLLRAWRGRWLCEQLTTPDNIDY